MKKKSLYYAALLLCIVLVLLWIWALLRPWVIAGTLVLVVALWVTRKRK